MTFTYKLTSSHIDVTAVYLFSRSISMAMTYYGNNNKIQTLN